MSTYGTRGLAGRAVWPIGLGCMGMSFVYGSAERNDERSVRLIRDAPLHGVRHLDTADLYGPFLNEELIGHALSGRRGDYLIATKCGLVIDPARGVVHDARPEHIASAVRASLGRLGTDHVDLLYLHRIDPAVPLEESWTAMTRAVEEGLVTHIGLSEVGVEELARAQQIHPVAAVQSELSLFSREPLTDGVLAWCAANEAAFVAYSPLGRGFLTGCYRSQADLEEDDWRRQLPRWQTDAIAHNGRLLSCVRSVAAKHGASLGQVALAWVLAQGVHVHAIPGSRRSERLVENAAAASLHLTSADLAELDALGAPAGARR